MKIKFIWVFYYEKKGGRLKHFDLYIKEFNTIGIEIVYDQGKILENEQF